MERSIGGRLDPAHRPVAGNLGYVFRRALECSRNPWHETIQAETARFGRHQPNEFETVGLTLRLLWVAIFYGNSITIQAGASGRGPRHSLCGRRENWRANWNSTQPSANMGRSCRSECIRAESKWEISVE